MSDRDDKRKRLTEIVEIINDSEMIETLSEEEITELVHEFDELALNPRGSDMIFYPQDDEEDLSPEELADRAMDYEPIQL